jgi:hypothetical protein
MAVEHPELQALTEWKPLARGGLARVWQARQVSLDRLIAVKVYNAKLDGGGEQRRFLQESAAAGRLSAHPNVVTVHDAGILADNRPYLLMDLYAAGSLTRWLKPENRPSEERVRHVGVRIADALAAAHAAGVLHRDLKPSNVLVDSYGEPALADFGLAVVEQVEADVVGDPVHATPAYAPPEVLRGERATEAGDVFSLAATLYALLAGRPPRRFDGGPLTQADLTRLADQPIPQLPQVNWNLMAALSDALSDDPAARPRAATLRDRLAALDLDAEGPRARRVPAVAMRDRGGRRASAAAVAASPLGRAALDDSPESPRRRALLVPILLVAALFVTGGWVAAWQMNQADHSSAAAATGAGAEAAPSASPEATGDGAATTHPTEHAVAAAQRLAACQRSVRAADRVMREAKVGIGHWREHVQAQTDMFAGKITGEEMGAIFTRTRLAGPADVQRYSDAVQSQARAKATCGPVEGSPAEISSALTRCQKRADAQKPVLAAAEDGMGDWSGHLSDMASRQQYRHNAQFHWLQTWRAAPPHLNAWKRSLEHMHAPSC